MYFLLYFRYMPALWQKCYKKKKKVKKEKEKKKETSKKGKKKYETNATKN